MNLNASVGVLVVGAQRTSIADDGVGLLDRDRHGDLGVGVLVVLLVFTVCRADDKARAHALDKGPEHLACGHTPARRGPGSLSRRPRAGRGLWPGRPAPDHDPSHYEGGSPGDGVHLKAGTGGKGFKFENRAANHEYAF